MFKIRISINSFLLAGIGLHLLGCQAESEVLKDDASLNINKTKVEVAEVKSLRPFKVITLPGELKAWEQVEIYPKVKGFIKEVKADRGSEVKKGQVLAVLESPETVAELSQSYASLQAALAALEESKAQFSSSQASFLRLLKASKTEGAVSENELDLGKSKMKADSALSNMASEQVNAARANYYAKKEIVNYLTVKAPFHGIIREKNISPGALVGAGNQQIPLFILENSFILRLTVSIPEIYSNALDTNSSVSFFVSSLPNKSIEARYARSSINIDQQQRAMIAEFDVENQAHLLRAGMYAEVKIPIKRNVPTLFVPQKAVVTNSEKVFVIKVNDGSAEWVTVKKGNVVDTLIEIFGNLRMGDKVVKKGSEEIRNGDPVKIN